MAFELIGSDKRIMRMEHANLERRRKGKRRWVRWGLGVVWGRNVSVSAHDVPWETSTYGSILGQQQGSYQALGCPEEADTRRRAPMLPKQLGRRCLSNVAAHDPSKFRNMALVAHIGPSCCPLPLFQQNLDHLIDSGKTTLTESILLSSSYISTPGSVDTGSTTTDFLPAERERGITIQSASIPVHWKHWKFNLIDTPGHADFGMEVESASRVVDGAVVLIDSVEGVEAQTRGVWRQLNR
jgi:hypothetical protein